MSLTHPSDDELRDIVTDYIEWAEAVRRIKTRYSELNPGPPARTLHDYLEGTGEKGDAVPGA